MLGGPWKAIVLAWAPELAKLQESQPLLGSFQALLPEEELCRGPAAFP
jgi:hypothetical protein